MAAKEPTVTPRHEAMATEILNREYGPSNHPADYGRKFTVCFRTTSSEHQIRELAKKFAEGEAYVAERAWDEGVTHALGDGSEGLDDVLASNPYRLPKGPTK